jgi:hypothetical protein
MTVHPGLRGCVEECLPALAVMPICVEDGELIVAIGHRPESATVAFDPPSIWQSG